MKLLLLAALALALAACGSSSSTSSSSTSASSSSASGPDVGTDGTEAVETTLRRFPGVDVRETADGVEVRVRGESSFMAGEEPLYVVDGSPIAPGPGGGLVGIRRADIVDIRVLKSASETSAYGPRGANGVVVITTRHASR